MNWKPSAMLWMKSCCLIVVMDSPSDVLGAAKSPSLSYVGAPRPDQGSIRLN
jgi:hypothetical protein